WKGDLLAVAVLEKDMKKDSDSKFENIFLKRLDEKIGGLLAEAVTEEDFTGKSGQSTVLRLHGLCFKRLGLVGIGSSSSTVTAYQRIGEAVAGVAKAAQANSVAVCLASSDGISEELKINAASAIASGSFSVGFNCSVLSCLFVLSDSKKPLLKTVDIIGFGSGTVVDQKLKYATDVCSGVIFGKELVNAPANVLTPGIHHIMLASLYFISITYLWKISYRHVKSNFHFLLQVNNTDAEGRLTLADALVYACNQGIDKVLGKYIGFTFSWQYLLSLTVVDLATLTGACIVALGPSIAANKVIFTFTGIYSPSDDLAKEIVTASEVTGEKFWRMPLEESYWESMKSGVADMVNTGGRQGGSITAALFLKQFVNEKVQWLHIDMAGPVWNDKKRCATGFGVSTLVEWVMKNSS
ncbi:hypothetical protein BHM03_00011002, partial [Ensete ventricosum]